MFLVRRPSDAELSQIAASMVDAPFTYDGWRPPRATQGYLDALAAHVREVLA